ncbi:MAG: hypothetical protein DDT30_02001 [Dehalococcoidia bacterium]|nr:hypothetical protein [Bacillota bacterium]MBT9143807.1 hypothetical protein [Bacillota bacterium]
MPDKLNFMQTAIFGGSCLSFDACANACLHKRGTKRPVVQVTPIQAVLRICRDKDLFTVRKIKVREKYLTLYLLTDLLKLLGRR